MSTSTQKDWWDKAKIIAEILAILAIIFYGNALSSSLKEREINIKLVEMAISVLRAEPSKDTDILRGWTVQIIDKLSGVPLSEEVKKELLRKRLPSKWLDVKEWNDNEKWKE